MSQLPPQFLNNIRQFKQMVTMSNGNIDAVLKNNPMLNQMAQAYKGQDYKQVFLSKCKKLGFDPEAILQELRS